MLQSNDGEHPLSEFVEQGKHSEDHRCLERKSSHREAKGHSRYDDELYWKGHFLGYVKKGTNFFLNPFWNSYKLFFKILNYKIEPLALIYLLGGILWNYNGLPKYKVEGNFLRGTPHSLAPQLNSTHYCSIVSFCLPIAQFSFKTSMVCIMPTNLHINAFSDIALRIGNTSSSGYHAYPSRHKCIQ